MTLVFPVFVVRGEHDPIGVKYRRGTDIFVPGTGHYVPVERPAELTAILSERLAPHLS